MGHLSAELVIVIVMGLLDEGISYWATLDLSDWLTACYVIVLILAVILSNWVFADFVASKPEGRKTVLGKFCNIVDTPL